MRTRIACPSFILSVLAFFIAVSNAQVVRTAPKPDPIIFPHDHETFYRTLSCALHLVGVSVIAYCLARRTDRLASIGLTSHTLTWWLVILIFIDSWLFTLISGILVSGVGLSLNQDSCDAGSFICIILYATSKLLIYWFLSEKVYFVHPRTSGSKFFSPAYRICITFVLGYVVIIIMAFLGRVAFLRDGHQTLMELRGPVGAGTDGQCVIGIGRATSITLLIYDLLLNVFFTGMFLYPVYRSSKLSPGLKTIAKKTLIAALVALATSAINICILMIMHGSELGWICLASCSFDIIVNALAIYIATSFVDNVEEPNSTQSGQGATGEHKQIRFVSAIGNGLRKVVPSHKPILPIANAGITSSTRGILETSNSRGGETTTTTTTRSVHFSPEVTRQDRPITGYDLDFQYTIGEPTGADRTTERRNTEPSSSNRPINTTPVMASFLPPPRSIIGRTPDKRQSMDLNITQMERPPVDFSDSGDSNEALTRRLPEAIYLHLLEIPPPEEPEDTTLEIRQEGHISRNPRKRPPCLISMAVAHARRRSKSVDSRNDEQRSSRVLRPPATNLSEPPSSIDEARTRLRVLSALMDITRGRRDSQTTESLLEVSVVTQTDRRIELRKKRDDLLDDYNGRKYDRRGRSASSSGGL